MLNDRYFGVPLWVWLIVLAIVIISYDKNSCLNPRSERFTQENSKIKIYNFNTEWCGYSKRFQPVWDDFSSKVNSQSISGLSNVEAIDVKCDNPANKQLCEEYKIPGFPSVLAVKDGKQVDFNGDRTTNSLVEFVKSL